MKPDLNFFDPGHHFPIPPPVGAVPTCHGLEVTREALLADKTPPTLPDFSNDPTVVERRAKQLSDKIASEPEWHPSTAALRDAILRRFTERLDAVADAHPDKLNQALAVIVQAGLGRTVLVISDPAAADLVTELRRHVDAGESSPLTALLQSRLPI